MHDMCGRLVGMMCVEDLHAGCVWGTCMLDVCASNVCSSFKIALCLQAWCNRTVFVRKCVCVCVFGLTAQTDCLHTFLIPKCRVFACGLFSYVQCFEVPVVCSVCLYGV